MSALDVVSWAVVYGFYVIVGSYAAVMAIGFLVDTVTLLMGGSSIDGKGWLNGPRRRLW
jgi:hypothetical protein